MKKKIFLIIYTFSLLLLTSCVTSVDSRHTEARFFQGRRSGAGYFASFRSAAEGS